MLVPSPTVTVPPGRMPSVNSDVPVVSGAVPIPCAGAGGVLAVLVVVELELALGVVELDGEELELPFEFSTFSTSCEIWLLTRLIASELAMLERPLDRLV